MRMVAGAGDERVADETDADVARGCGRGRDAAGGGCCCVKSAGRERGRELAGGEAEWHVVGRSGKRARYWRRTARVEALRESSL
jgi:hypothetical protein